MNSFLRKPFSLYLSVAQNIASAGHKYYLIRNTEHKYSSHLGFVLTNKRRAEMSSASKKVEVLMVACLGGWSGGRRRSRGHQKLPEVIVGQLGSEGHKQTVSEAQEQTSEERKY